MDVPDGNVMDMIRNSHCSVSWPCRVLEPLGFGPELELVLNLPELEKFLQSSHMLVACEA